MSSGEDFYIEQAVLGSSIVEPGALHVMTDLVKDERYFVQKKNQVIYGAIMSMYRKEQPLDEVTLYEYMREKKLLSKAGGADYIAQLCNNQITPALVESYCRVLKNRFLKRMLNQGLRNMMDKLEKDVDDPMSLVNDTIEFLQDLSVETSEDHMSMIALDAVEIVQEVEDEKPTDLVIYPTKIKAFDDKVGGIDASFQTWAARPGMGKTSLMLTCAYNLAGQKVPVGVFSLEMPKKKLAMRVLSMGSGIPFTKIKRHLERKKGTPPLLSKDEREKLAVLSRKLSQYPLMVDDTTTYDIFDIKSRIINLNKKKGVKVFFIDYLGLIDRTQLLEKMRDDRAVGEITRTLKNLSQSLNVPIIALHQLSRETEKGESKRPTLRNLRDSGRIEEDSESVLFLFRPDYYDEKVETKKGRPLKGITELNWAKSRNGAPGTKEVFYDKPIMTFKDSEYYLEKRDRKDKESQNMLTLDLTGVADELDNSQDDAPF